MNSLELIFVQNIKIFFILNPQYFNINQKDSNRDDPCRLIMM